MQGDISNAQKIGIRCVSGFISGFLGGLTIMRPLHLINEPHDT